MVKVKGDKSNVLPPSSASPPSPPTTAPTPPITVDPKATYICSFCGNKDIQVKVMIAGMNKSAICNECVVTCINILIDHAGRR